MQKTVTIVGPADHGRRMSLAEFDTAEGREGHRYEPSRGIITVTDVPDIKHFAQVDEIREQLSAYRRASPGVVFRIGTGSECKLLVEGLESERHPDLAVYKAPPPAKDIWAAWVPDVVVEVVSPSSRHRDYEEKPEEYLRFGVREYWIVDEQRQQMTVLRRSGARWLTRIVGPGKSYQTRLPLEFEFDLGPVFPAARSAGRP